MIITIQNDGYQIWDKGDHNGSYYCRVSFKDENGNIVESNKDIRYPKGTSDEDILAKIEAYKVNLEERLNTPEEIPLDLTAEVLELQQQLTEATEEKNALENNLDQMTDLIDKLDPLDPELIKAISDAKKQSLILNPVEIVPKDIEPIVIEK